MSKPIKPAYELTDAEQRDLIALLQQGRPLPERYRFILFEDKREVELVWNGKSRDVCTTVLPLIGDHSFPKNDEERLHISKKLTAARRILRMFPPRCGPASPTVEG